MFIVIDCVCSDLSNELRDFFLIDQVENDVTELCKRVWLSILRY